MTARASSVDFYDVAVVGGGPAGIMASIRAAQLKKSAVLIERNVSVGRKILITGKGRCNLSNSADIEGFIEKFGKSGQSLRSAFYKFSNNDLVEFLKKYGVATKVERQGRIFPSDDKSLSVVRALEKALADNGVKVLTGSRVMVIREDGGIFILKTEEAEIWAKKLVLATGGASYKATGSTGDGFHFAKLLGHTFNSLRPGLVPLKTKERWVTELQGLTLKNIRIVFECGGKKITSETGELLFTHFGVSGPLVLDLSARVVDLLQEKKEVTLSIDLKPGLTREQLNNRMLREIETRGSINIKTLLKEMLPLKMIQVFASALNLDPAKRINQLTRGEREGITELLKDFRMTVTGALPLEEAMVTCGGIPVKDINPRTMESRIMPGLYFAGEIIDATAPSGGYNLQQAFSTGYLAGESAGA